MCAHMCCFLIHIISNRYILFYFTFFQFILFFSLLLNQVFLIYISNVIPFPVFCMSSYIFSLYFSHFLFIYLFFPIFCKSGISYLHFKHYSLSCPSAPSPPLLYGCPSPSTSFLPPPHIPLHWGSSLGRTKGFPYHWYPLGYPLLRSMQSELWVSPCVPFG